MEEGRKIGRILADKTGGAPPLEPFHFGNPPRRSTSHKPTNNSSRCLIGGSEVAPEAESNGARFQPIPISIPSLHSLHSRDAVTDRICHNSSRFLQFLINSALRIEVHSFGMDPPVSHFSIQTNSDIYFHILHFQHKFTYARNLQLGFT